jgi:carbon-monoxide dehydrogenase large subunit
MAKVLVATEKPFAKAAVEGIKKIFTIIVIFNFNKKNSTLSNNGDFMFKIIANLEEFLLLKINNFFLNNDLRIRFQRGDKMSILYNDHKIFSYGWISSKDIFIEEINVNLINKDKIILYDFFTFEEYRNKGYFLNNILNILSFFEKKNLIDILKWDPEFIRIIHHDVGGGFGPKAIFYPEEAMVAIAAHDLLRPVKWIEDRREHFYTATQERDQWWDISIALDANAKILAMKIDMTHDNGAYLPWGIITPYIGVTTTPGPYVIPAIDVNLKVVYTNKNATSPVRGAGRPQAVFAMERILDKAARQLGIDRAEIRRRNFIQPEQMPYNNGFIYRDGKPMVYDSGDYPQCQALALEKIAYDDFPARKAAALKEGRYLGIGIANFVEGTGLGPFEGATVRVQQTGRITILTSASSQGQGHKTTFMQICADQLQVPLAMIDVITADTNAISMGIGTFASRVTVNAGNSVFLASQKVAEKIKGLAAFLMQTRVDNIQLIDGHAISIDDPSKKKSFAELARVSQGMPGFSFPEGVTNGLESTEYFSPAQSTYCNGTAAVEIELDRDTCQINILKYVMTHDSGNLINPLLVDGQVQGSIAHGIGNSTLEDMQYDDQAQPITTNFGEYLLPMATDVPKVQMYHLHSPSPLNPLGVKGAGEGGTIPAAAAIVAAIEDAISDTGIFLTQAPMTPPRLFEILKKAGAYSSVTS